MTIQVDFHTGATTVLREAEEFLSSDPVVHNLILTLLHARVRSPEPGRYWIARAEGTPVGVVFQSPPHFGATLTPMAPETVHAVVDSIADQGILLPGVHGDAATVAAFAGYWSEQCHCGVVPVEGQRLYELREVNHPEPRSGRCRQAVPADRQLLEEWVRDFSGEVGQHSTNPSTFVGHSLSAGRLWLWDDGKPQSMAAYSEPVNGVARIQGVYTPPRSRNQGYAAACVAELSRRLLGKQFRSVLYTDLGNPTSNSVYRRIGYRAVTEILWYRFNFLP